MSDRNTINVSDIPAARGAEIIQGSRASSSSRASKKTQFKMETVKMEPKPNLNIGIEETLDAIKFVTATANAIDAAISDDGKITIGDFPKFLAPVTKLPAAIAGIAKLPSEVMDLQEDEKIIIVDAVKEGLSISANAEEITAAALNIAYEIKQLADLIGQSKN